MESMTILSVNAGSSSIKMGLFAVHGETVEGIAETSESFVPGAHGAVMGALTQWLTQTLGDRPLAGIGHRIVQGGPHALAPARITDSLVEKITQFSAYDPEHATAALQLITAVQGQFPNVPQVACFDAAFFRSMPRVAQLLPLPRKYDEQGVRRYGFHGLSYAYLLSALEAAYGHDVAQGRIIFAHLGSGASLAAVHKGKPVDTTMGFTPASGVMMSCRSGDIDPGVAWYLQQKAGIDAEAFNKMVTYESGLLGISGLSADMYTLLQQQGDNTHAAEAIELFCYQIKKAIGAFSAVLGGLDTVVFSGGIGERSALIRGQITDGLDYLGVDVDSDRNAAGAALISAPTSRVAVHVLHTDENAMVAHETAHILGNNRE